MKRSVIFLFSGFLLCMGVMAYAQVHDYWTIQIKNTTNKKISYWIYWAKNRNERRVGGVEANHTGVFKAWLKGSEWKLLVGLYSSGGAYNSCGSFEIGKDSQVIVTNNPTSGYQCTVS